MTTKVAPYPNPCPSLLYTLCVCKFPFASLQGGTSGDTQAARDRVSNFLTENLKTKVFKSMIPFAIPPGWDMHIQGMETLKG